ncbi:MAG: TetR/AcrR family transcriptional regulator, partial [Tetrasphaera sp.]|nr:TetR/AcrR family transcriptional regulator [Tetrasphaera sp.]
EREGFREFFRFVAAHPGIYRVVREAEFVAPEAMRRHYTNIVGGYVDGLLAAKAVGEVDPDLDPKVTAWALMGVGEMIGMRWILWEGSDGEVPDEVLDEMTRFIRRGLGGGPDRTQDGTGQEQT